MTALTPHEVDRMVSTVLHLISDIGPEYRWLHSVGYGKGRRGDPIGHASDAGDPTGGIVTSTERIHVRRALVDTTDALDDVIRALKAVRYRMDHALRDEEPAPGVMGRAMVTRAELAESHANKTKREDRGEGWGDG